MKKDREILLTKEDVRRFRRSLEKKTRRAFKKFAEMKRKSWAQAKNMVLD